MTFAWGLVDGSSAACSAMASSISVTRSTKYCSCALSIHPPSWASTPKIDHPSGSARAQ
ncbi:MAG: hypothetical protein ACXV95_12505 [Acidimicrobiales bacterium]